jgi:hypothetical protein
MSGGSIAPPISIRKVRFNQDTRKRRRLADLLVVDGDPSADITLLQNRANLHIVMKGGEFVECELTPSKATAKAA